MDNAGNGVRGFQYKHTRFPQEKLAALSASLSVPGYLVAPLEGDTKYPETLFESKFIRDGYHEICPLSLSKGQSEHSSLLQILQANVIVSNDNNNNDNNDDNEKKNKSSSELSSFIERVKSDLKQWEFRRSARVVHRRDGLTRFLNRMVMQKTKEEELHKSKHNQYSTSTTSGATKKADWKDEWLREFSMGEKVDINTEEIPFFRLHTTDTVFPVLEGLSKYRCPLSQATWFIKVTWLKNKLPHEQLTSASYINNYDGQNRYGTMGLKVAEMMRLEWTKRIVLFLKMKIRSIPQYTTPGRARANKLIVSKKRQLNHLSRGLRQNNAPKSPSNNGSGKSKSQPEINKGNLMQYKYICSLARWQFDCSLLSRDYFLNELLKTMEGMRKPQGPRKRVLPLSLCCLLVSYVLDYAEHMSMPQIEKLWTICTKIHTQLLWLGSDDGEQESIYSNLDFKPLCCLLQLGVQIAGVLGRQRLGEKEWDDALPARFRNISNQNQRIPTKQTHSHSPAGRRNKKTSNVLCNENFLFCDIDSADKDKEEPPSTVLDFSKIRKPEPAIVDDAWAKVEYIPNTENLFHLLATARRLKRK